MPDIRFGSEAEVPADFKQAAVKKDDGAYYVDVSLTSRVNEFRDTNTGLKKKVDQLEPELARHRRLVGDNPDQFEQELTDLRTTAQKVKDGLLKGNEAIETEIVKRVKAQQDTWSAERQTLHTERNAAQTAAKQMREKHDRLMLNQQVNLAAVKENSPVNSAALPDILARAERTWRVLDDGSFVAMEGDSKLYSKKGDGTQLLTMDEWLEGLVKAAPYLGKPSAGGGGPGNRSGSADDSEFGSQAFNNLPPNERIARFRASQRKRA